MLTALRGNQVVAYVQYAWPEDATRAIQAMDGTCTRSI